MIFSNLAHFYFWYIYQWPGSGTEVLLSHFADDTNLFYFNKSMGKINKFVNRDMENLVESYHKKQIVWKHGPNWPFYVLMLRTKLY